MFEGYVFLEKNGAPAKDRFTDPRAVNALYQKLSEDIIEESKRWARIFRLYSGNLPYRPADLENSGLKDLTNVNFMGLKGTIDNRAELILKLKSDTANLIELRPIARELAGPDAERIGRVFSEEFSTMLRQNGEFIDSMAMMNKEADLYGLGPVTWETDMSYCPVALERAQIRFRENASVVSSKNDLYMFESTITADYLQSLRDNREMASQLGWDMDAVDKWMVKVFREGAETQHDSSAAGTTPLMHAESLHRRNIVAEDKQFDDFHVIHVFVKEIAWPRGITHIMMPAAEDADFLYYRKNAYRTMDECFIWFPYSTTEKYAREVRGLGSFLYAPERLKNRFLCRMFDSAYRAGALTLETQNGASPQTAQQLSVNEVGPYTVLPPGVRAAQSQVAPNFQQLIQVAQVIDQVAVSSTLGSDKQPLASTATKLFKGSSDRQSKEEVELQQAIRAHKTEAEFAERKDVIDKICRESVRRALALMALPPFARVDYPEIQDFLDRCAIRGVTLEHILAIPQMFSIVACRDLALGADGKVAELDAFHQQYAGEMDETGRRKLARKRAELRFGRNDADELIPEANRDQAPTDQASKAVDENNLMKLGFTPMCGQDQLHWSHIPVHAQLLQEIAQMVAAPEDNTPDLNDFNGDPNQSMHVAERTLQNLQDDPKKILGILVMCSKHVQEHLAIGGQQLGMEGQAKQVAKMLRDLRPTIKALNLAVATQERVQQAREEQAQRDEEKRIDQLAAEKAQVAQIEADAKAKTDMYRIDREHEVQMHRADLEAGRASADESRKAAQFANEESRKDAALQGQLERDQKMTEAKVNAANAVSRMNAVQDATGFGSVPPGEIAQMGPSYSSL